MELSANTVESLFTLKHRLLHFIAQTNDHQNEIETRDQQIVLQTESILQLKQRIGELERSNTKLNLQLQQHQHEQQQLALSHQKQSNQMGSTNSGAVPKDHRMGDNSVLQGGNARNGAQSGHLSLGLDETNNQLREQLETMKTALIEAKSVSNTLQIDADRRQRDLDLLQVKHTYMLGKYKTLESNIGNSINDMSTTLTTKTTSFDTIQTDFHRFLTLYQSNVIYTTEHMSHLHVNIDQLNLALETKLKTELRLERDLVRVKGELAQKEAQVQDLMGQNASLTARHDHFSKQYKHTLGLLQSNLLLGLQQHQQPAQQHYQQQPQHQQQQQLPQQQKQQKQQLQLPQQPQQHQDHHQSNQQQFPASTTIDLVQHHHTPEPKSEMVENLTHTNPSNASSVPTATSISSLSSSSSPFLVPTIAPHLDGHAEIPPTAHSQHVPRSQYSSAMTQLNHGMEANNGPPMLEMVGQDEKEAGQEPLMDTTHQPLIDTVFPLNISSNSTATNDSGLEQPNAQSTLQDQPLNASGEHSSQGQSAQPSASSPPLLHFTTNYHASHALSKELMPQTHPAASQTCSNLTASSQQHLPNDSVPNHIPDHTTLHNNHEIDSEDLSMNDN